MKRIISAVLACILTISAVLVSKPISSYAKSTPDGFTKKAENDSLILYINEEDCNVCVYDKAGDNYWYTNPADVEADTFATNYYKRLMKSQLSVTFYNDQVQSQTMDSYNDCIMNSSFLIEDEEDGVKVVYSIGKAASMLIIPDVISKDRMEIYMAQMTDAQLKKVKRNYTLIEWEGLGDDDRTKYLEAYPGFENIPFYVLRGGIKDYLKEEIAGYFVEAGYTAEDMEADLIASGSVEGENDDPWFKVSMVYKLSGNGLTATVPMEELSYNDNGYYLTSINILPYFGAATGEDGYIFVPDGSGAIINFDNGKTLTSAYIANVYGNDLTGQVLSNQKSEMDPEYAVKMPVFGIKREQGACFAIIESAAALASINADVSGRTTSYNTVNASFSYLQYGAVSLSDMIGTNKYQLYSAFGPSEDISIRYSFLGAGESDYSHMAALYRDYLIEKGALKERVGNTDPMFAAELIGAIDKYKSFLGIKYSAIEPLTTFANAKTILTELNANGLSGVTVVYDGWSKGGLRGNADTGLGVLGKLQRGEKLSAFIGDAASLGAEVYLTTDLQYVYKDKAFDGYSKLSMSPNYFDHTKVEAKDFNISDGKKDGTMANLISPCYVSTVEAKVNKVLSKYGEVGVNLGTASGTLFSDYLESRYTDRSKAQHLYEEAFESLASNLTSVLSDNANVYALAYSDKVIGAPLYSNRQRIVDADVPFYEMVIHGYVNYTGEAINMSDDYRTTFLKSIESGAGLRYLWIYADNSVLKETEYDNLYAVSYQTWLDSAVSDYNELKAVLSGLGDKTISLHEILADGVTKTVYEDGTTIYVNYNKESVDIDKVSVPAKGYLAIKGETK